MRVTLFLSLLISASAGAQVLPDAGLVYSGLLLGPSGQPLTQSAEQVGLNVWDEPTGGNTLCSLPPNPVKLQQGRFTLPLGPTCGQRMVDAANVYLEVLVGNPPVVQPRTAVSAVHSAGRAVVAGTAQRTLARQGSQVISGNGLFCGATAGTTNTGAAITAGPLSGYKAWRAGCIAGCGNSPTAHPCTSGEMLNSHLLGININSNGWVVTATGDDCNGFTSSSTSSFGNYWTEINPVGVGQFLRASCNNLTQFLCCD